MARISHHDERYNKIVVGQPGFEIQTESYNRLKDNILYFNLDGKVKVIQVLSSIPTEGKTITTTNLAVALALSNQKVIVVDGDLRSPRAHRTLEGENEIGIADYLLDELSLDKIIQHTKYGVDLISRGRKIENPSAAVSSEKFKDLIEKLRDQYDYVLVDCPPVLEISDYIQISTVVDGAILCVAYASTKKGIVKETMKLLRQANVNVLGTVFTFVDEKKSHSKYDYGYKYGYNYGYYHSEKSENKEEKEENKEQE